MRVVFRTFEDLARLDARSTLALLRSVEQEQLALAMMGASAAVRAHVFRNVTGTTARLLQEAMQDLAPPSYREVDGAQGAILAKADQLLELGLVKAPAAPA